MLLELHLDQAEELLYALDEGFLDEHLSLFIHICFVSKVVDGELVLSNSILIIVWRIGQIKVAVRVDHVCVLRVVPVILYKAEV